MSADGRAPGDGEGGGPGGERRGPLRGGDREGNQRGGGARVGHPGVWSPAHDERGGCRLVAKRVDELSLFQRILHRAPDAATGVVMTIERDEPQCWLRKVRFNPRSRTLPPP